MKKNTITAIKRQRFFNNKQVISKYLTAIKMFFMHFNSDVFDADWYLFSNQDVKKSGCNPLWHFFLFGIYEQRAPNKNFHKNSYLILNQDVASSNINPVLHYLLYGFKENREINISTTYELHHLHLQSGEKNQQQKEIDELHSEVEITNAYHLLKILEKSEIKNEVLISIYHSNYKHFSGGVELIISIEEAAAKKNNISYLNIYPVK